MLVELVHAGAPAWDRFLANVEHDVYHLPGYSGLSARLEPARDHATAHAVIVRDGDRALFLPMVLRTIPASPDRRDGTSPYGYPGPLWLGNADRSFRRNASRALVDRLRAEGIVSLFVRTHPLLNGDVDGLAAAGTIVEHGSTVSIDLTASTEALWSATRPGHRSEIKLAMRRGARAFLDDAWTHESTFVALYDATMARLGASQRYHFSGDYVRSLREALGPRLHLCVVEVEDHIAAAGLFTESCGIVQYHLSGSDPAFARLAPTKLMLHHVREVMKARGNRVMHLGGGVEAFDDSLFRFKAGFSDRRQPFRTWRVVVDPHRYAALSEAVDPAADPADFTGYFPIYRREDA